MLAKLKYLGTRRKWRIFRKTAVEECIVLLLKVRRLLSHELVSDGRHKCTIVCCKKTDPSRPWVFNFYFVRDIPLFMCRKDAFSSKFQLQASCTLGQQLSFFHRITQKSQNEKVHSLKWVNCQVCKKKKKKKKKKEYCSCPWHRTAYGRTLTDREPLSLDVDTAWGLVKQLLTVGLFPLSQFLHQHQVSRLRLKEMWLQERQQFVQEMEVTPVLMFSWTFSVCQRTAIAVSNCPFICFLNYKVSSPTSSRPSTIEAEDTPRKARDRPENGGSTCSHVLVNFWDFTKRLDQ